MIIRKNGINGGVSSILTINSGTFSTSKNALACGHLLTINDRTITITSQSEGIKAEPDSDDEKEQLKLMGSN